MIEAYFGGTASYGIVIFKDGKKIFEASRIFHPQKGKEEHTSNNVAEYSGFKAILDYLLEHELHRSQILIRGDSNLVIQQMFATQRNHGKRWKIHGGFYAPIAALCKQLLTQFTSIGGEWIPREQKQFSR